MNEKHGLIGHANCSKKTFSNKFWRALILINLAGCLLLLTNRMGMCSRSKFKLPANPYASIKPLSPSSSKVDHIMNDPEFKKKSLETYQGALRIPTQVFDSSPKPQDSLEGWEPFLELHKYWEKTFPLVHKTMKLEKINKLGYLLTWQGSDPSLKPLLFLAHQDVVPVDENTLHLWKYPPFEAHYDGKYVYARGASDTKNSLVGTFEAFEELIKDGFKPKRTIIYAAGYDEEAIGRYDGAVTMSKLLQDRYGQKSFYASVDEGGGAMDSYGSVIASPNVGEKGYCDVYIELRVAGGHSSIPPDHTGIGIMGSLAALIEANPYETVLTDDNPLLDYLRTVGETAVDLDEDVKQDFIMAKYDAKARARVVELLKTMKLTKYLIRTSQAIDVINGGVKINALPEVTTLGINHRISLELTAQDVIDNVLKYVEVIARKNDLGVEYEDTQLVQGSQGSFKVYAVQPLDPPMISKTEGKTWDVFASTIKHVFDDLVFAESNTTVAVVPSFIGAYTDTSRYIPLTDYAYRFIAAYTDPYSSNAHAINERFEFDGHLSTIAFIYEYILNVDEYHSAD